MGMVLEVFHDSLSVVRRGVARVAGKSGFVYKGRARASPTWLYFSFGPAVASFMTPRAVAVYRRGRPSGLHWVDALRVYREKAEEVV